MTKAFHRLKDWFSFDTRSLALARMGLGCCIFFDLFTRLHDLEWHYSDIGLIPRQLFMSEVGFPWSFSLYFANGTILFAGALMVFHALCALSLALGWQTRLMTILNAILLTSLHNRNWFINNGGDDVIRCLMILSIFIPWGEIWSIDQWRSGRGEVEGRKVSGTWVLCWFLQAFCIYFISFSLKTSHIWRSDFTALYYASHLNIFTTWFGELLRPFSLILKGLTFYAITVEWLGPAILALGYILPRKWWTYTRLFVVLIFWGLHGGIIMTMNIGLFPYYCIFMWSAFLPTEFWHFIFKKRPSVELKIKKFFSRISGTPKLLKNKQIENKRVLQLIQALGVVFFFNIFFWNLSTYKPFQIQVPFWMTVGRWTHMYQEWGMFAPFPKQEDMWIELPAELEDGTKIELLSLNKDLTLSTRADFPSNVPNEHWRKLFLNLAENEKLARYYGGAWCRIWNRPIKDGGRLPRLRQFEVLLKYDIILEDYKRSEVQSRVAWKHWCFESDFKVRTVTPGL